MLTLKSLKGATVTWNNTIISPGENVNFYFQCVVNDTTYYGFYTNGMITPIGSTLKRVASAGYLLENLKRNDAYFTGLVDPGTWSPENSNICYIIDGDDVDNQTFIDFVLANASVSGGVWGGVSGVVKNPVAIVNGKVKKVVVDNMNMTIDIYTKEVSNEEPDGYKLTIYDSVNTSTLDNYANFVLNGDDTTKQYLGYLGGDSIENTFTYENVTSVQFFIDEAFGLVESLCVGTTDGGSDICSLSSAMGGIESEIITLTKDAVWYVSAKGKDAPELDLEL